MSKEYQEPEEQLLDNNDLNAEIVDNYNPLGEPVIEKPYTKPNVTFKQSDMIGDIPEPSFMPPPMGGSPVVEEIKSKRVDAPPVNPEMKDLSKKDKTDAASKVAGMIMTGYKWVNELADKSLLINEKKVLKMQQNGEIDLAAEVPFSATETMTVGEFIGEYNGQTEGTIMVTPQFEEEVTPILTSVLAKRGIGMTEEQQLIYLFGKDIAVKGFMMMQSNGAKKEIMIMMKEASSMRSSASAPQPQKPQQQESQPPQPQPSPDSDEVVLQPQYEQEIPSVNDFVNEMTGSKPPTPKMEVVKAQVIKQGKPPLTGRRGRPAKK